MTRIAVYLATLSDGRLMAVAEVMLHVLRIPHWH